MPWSFGDGVVELNVLLDVIEFRFDLFRIVISATKILKSFLGFFRTVSLKKPAGSEGKASVALHAKEKLPATGKL